MNFEVVSAVLRAAQVLRAAGHDVRVDKRAWPVPCLVSVGERPVGVQLVCCQGNEYMLIGLAAEIEEFISEQGKLKKYLRA